MSTELERLDEHVQREDREFDLLRDDARGAWWSATRDTARAAVQVKSGTRLYVTESVDELAKAERQYSFLEVHVVSSATGSSYEFRRAVHVPALRRLVPIANIAMISPIVDDEVPT